MASRGRFDPCPRSQAGYERARARLAAEIGAWLEASGRGDVDPGSGEELLHYKWGYLDGHLTRWRRADLDTILCELFPAKVIVEEEDLGEVIPEARSSSPSSPRPAISTRQVTTRPCSSVTSTASPPASVGA